MGSMAVATTNPPSWVTLPTNMGTIAAGGASTFGVIFGSNIVSNEGVYDAEISFFGNFVNDVPNLPLTMNISEGKMLSVPSEINFGDVCIYVTSNYILDSLESVDYNISFTPNTIGNVSNIIYLTGAGSNTTMLIGGTAPTLKTIPEFVNFADTLLGKTNTQVVIYENIGGGIAAGSVTGDSLPFSIGGNTTYSLAPNEDSYFFINFAPNAVGIYSNTISLSGGGDTKVLVTGKGIPEPIAIWIIGLLVPLIKGGARKGGGF